MVGFVSIPRVKVTCVDAEGNLISSYTLFNVLMSSTSHSGTYCCVKVVFCDANVHFLTQFCILASGWKSPQENISLNYEGLEMESVSLLRSPVVVPSSFPEPSTDDSNSLVNPSMRVGTDAWIQVKGLRVVGESRNSLVLFDGVQQLFSSLTRRSNARMQILCNLPQMDLVAVGLTCKRLLHLSHSDRVREVERHTCNIKVRCSRSSAF